jgi:phage terminase large subunit-like protein
MGKPGPQREPDEALAKRGSRQRQKGKKKPKLRLRPPAVEVEPIPIYDFEETTRLLPGYDPWAKADAFEFKPEVAEAVVRFFHEDLRHVKGPKARTPFYLEKWQQGVVGNLFGWSRKSDGTRRYRTAFIYLPRKNGKTPLVAGIIVYCLFEEDEIGAELYGAASEYKQASLVFEHARGMVVQNPRLMDQCKILSGQAKSIQLTDPEMLYSTYRVVSSDGGAAHGFNSSVFVVDELHTQKGDELVEALETSTAARLEPLGIYITTADFERQSVCNEMHAHACKVRDNPALDPELLPVICEVGRDADWTDRAVWAAANPNLGISVQLSYIEAACKKAQERPALENRFKRLHLNIKTEQVSRWLAMDAWDACGDDVDDPLAWRERQMELLRGATCCGGLDIGSTSDLTSLVLLFDLGERDLLLPFFWIPAKGVQRKDHKHRTLYETWIRQGFMAKTDGDECDYSRVVADIDELGDRFGIREIAADRLFQGAQLCQDLARAGFEMVKFGQGFLSMAAPAKEFEERMIGGRLAHGNNPVLRWMASNARAKEDEAGNIKPVKPKRHSSLKVDGIVAGIMALGRFIAAEWEPEEHEPTVMVL